MDRFVLWLLVVGNVPLYILLGKFLFKNREGLEKYIADEAARGDKGILGGWNTDPDPEMRSMIFGTTYSRILFWVFLCFFLLIIEVKVLGDIFNLHLTLW